MKINPNIGRVDQVLRVGTGLALLIAPAARAIGLWGLVGVVPLLTGLVRVCPLYSALGVNTCSSAKRPV